MTTSAGTSFPSRFTRIDDLTRGDHNHLLPEDECLFFGDYTARKGWAHSATNQLILNFKIPVNWRGTNRWPHKQRAIRTVADLFSARIGPRFEELTLVPVPPSKLKTDPEYDDRMMDMLRALKALARRAVLAWEGIGDADGNPIDPSPEAIDALLDIWPVFEAFQLNYVSKGLLLEQEKNASALSPNGPSAGATDIAPPAKRRAKAARRD